MAYGTLVVRARSTWKQQVAALYPIMAIHPLESEASAAICVSALRLIRRLASDSQVLVDLFVNYDCDLHAENLYERTVTALAKSAQVSDVLERDAVLTCLFSILRSLQAWHARGDGSASTEDGEETSTVEDDDPRFDGELRPVMTTTRRSRGSAASLRGGPPPPSSTNGHSSTARRRRKMRRTMPSTETTSRSRMLSTKKRRIRGGTFPEGETNQGFRGEGDRGVQRRRERPNASTGGDRKIPPSAPTFCARALPAVV